MGKIRNLGRGTVWETARIRAEQAAIKQELDRHTDPRSPRSRLQYALSRVRDLEDGESPIERLRRYIFVVSALVHNERQGGLSPAQAERLFHLANAILKVSGIRSGRSRLGFLYGDLYQVGSQGARRNGQAWLAAWEQQFSVYANQMSRRRATGVPGLALGIRHLRLGDTATAIGYLEQARADGLSERSEARAVLEMCKAWRLAGQTGKAAQEMERVRRAGALNEEERRELEWEAICAEVVRGGDITGLVTSCLPGRPHHHYAYLLECFFWTRAVRTRQWLERFPKLASFSPSEWKSPRKQFGHWFTCVKALEDLYDQEIPFELRLERLGECLAERGKFLSVDKELLFLAAAWRWLSRNRSDGFAAIVANEYRALSWRLSRRATSDALGVVSDLFEGEWAAAA